MILHAGYEIFAPFAANQFIAVKDKKIALVNQRGEKIEVFLEATDNMEKEEAFVSVEKVSENLIVVGSSEGNLFGFNKHLELLGIFKITEVVGVKRPVKEM